MLAAQTRVDAPGAAAAAERRWRRYRAAPPPLSEEDVEILRRARASAAAAGSLSIGMGYGASALVLPRLSLRPRAFDGGGGLSAASPPPPPPPPAVIEAASRGLAIGARAAAYGSALALAGAALASLWAARSLRDEGDAVDASLALKETLLPLGDAARGFLQPIASWAREELGGGGDDDARRGSKGKKSNDGDFSVALGRKLDASKRKWASRAGIGSADSV